MLQPTKLGLKLTSAVMQTIRSRASLPGVCTDGCCKGSQYSLLSFPRYKKLGDVVYLQTPFSSDNLPILLHLERKQFLCVTKARITLC